MDNQADQNGRQKQTNIETHVKSEVYTVSEVVKLEKNLTLT